MAATQTRSNSGPSSAPEALAAKGKQAGESVAAAARRGKGPLLVAAAGATGLAGGLALGSWRASKRRGLTKVLGALAKEMGSATKAASNTSDDVRSIRRQLKDANKQSPVEVLLDGLTHRRGAHKEEG
jgi:hypothetical protein